MADTYGEFRFHLSEDCQLDRQGLALALKRFRWDSSGGECLWWLPGDQAHARNV